MKLARTGAKMNAKKILVSMAKHPKTIWRSTLKRQLKKDPPGGKDWLFFLVFEQANNALSSTNKSFPGPLEEAVRFDDC